jgi:TetR/AcrR family acrAB operon transcriptional repressor
MARKTKAEAALTRHRIVESARQVFSRAGVTNTSLEEIAQEAGVTRGAVYWHFRDKADLFRAVRADTGTLLRLEPPGSADALRRLETTLLEAIHRLRREPAARQTYEVMLWKCEYVDELAPVRTELMKAGEAFAGELRELYAQAASEGLTERGLDPRLAALETLCLYAGMVKLWLADMGGELLRSQVEAMIRQHVASRRRREPALTPPPASPRKKAK